MIRRMLSSRAGYILVAVLFASAAAVVIFRATRPGEGKSRPDLGPVVKALVPPTFPPMPAVDRADPDPTDADRAEVDRLMVGLSGPAAGGTALASIERLKYTDLPFLDAVAARPGAPPQLVAVMGRIRARDDFARRNAHRNDVVADFYEREAMTEYARGRTDPKWDAIAFEFLHRATARYAMHRPAAVDANLSAARDLLRKATAAGCDDPTVLTFGGLVEADAGSPPDVVLESFRRADQSVRGGTVMRGIVDYRLLAPYAAWPLEQRSRQWKQIADRLDDLAAQVNAIAAKPGCPPAVAVNFVRFYCDRAAAVSCPARVPVHCVLDPLAAKLGDDPRFLAVKGKVYIDWGWEARGTGYASSITPEGMKDFADRLDVAEAALNRAWQLDPTDPAVPRWMMQIARSRGDGLDAMQAWFDRAVSIDPDDAAACWEKLENLEPKWAGSPELMIQFGHQCLAAGNWTTTIPTVLADAHWRLANRYADDPVSYWLRPGVWDDCRAVYDGYLTHGGNATYSRNQLARYAFLCRRWKVADEQFRLLGDRADADLYGVIGCPIGLDDARKLTARLAARPDSSVD